MIVETLALAFTRAGLAAPLAVLIELGLSRDERFVRACIAYLLALAALFSMLAPATRGRSFEHLLVYTAAASDSTFARHGDVQ